MASDVLQGDGFSVRLGGRSGLKYREGERVMKVDAEMLTGAVDLVVYGSSIGSWSDGSPANEADRRRILRNIRELLARENINVEID